MDDTQLQDLKQFIAGTVGQSEERIKTELRQEIQELRTEMHNGFAGVGEAIEEIHKVVAALDTKTDARLTALEQRA